MKHAQKRTLIAVAAVSLLAAACAKKNAAVPPPPPPVPVPLPKMPVLVLPHIPPPVVQVKTPPPVEHAITAVASPDPTPPAPPASPMAEVVAAAPAHIPPVLDAARSCRPPQYPPISRRNEEAGAVVLRFLIDVDGQVVDSQIESSSGFDRLDEAARDALSLCRFKPGSIDGRPEKSWARMKYVWKIT